MIRAISIVLIALGLLVLIAPGTRSEENQDKVLVATVDGIINPVSAEFIKKQIKRADDMRAQLFVIELDTPGGLMDSMRDIIKGIIASRVPVAVFVSPGGARAASAGTFITIAAHIAAMAPSTNIGAAHPVGVGGKMDEKMIAKVTNDAVAYIRGLADKRGRNADWAEQAVRKSISATEQEALEKNVIDLITNDLETLLLAVDGMNFETSIGKVTIRTKGAVIVRAQMSARQRILDLISNPNVAYILMMLGFYGLFFEVTNPGAIFPGVVGGISLILAFYAFQTLPVNYAGLLLIILGIILFVLELKVTSYGALTIGGLVAMVLGSVMLIDSPGPFMKLSLYTILPATLGTAAFFTIALRLVYKAQVAKPVTGMEGLLGLVGRATTDFDSDGGMVHVRGELWRAYSEEPIAKGDHVTVIKVEGLMVRVKKT